MDRIGKRVERWGRSVVEEALNARREVLYQQVHLISIRPLGITPPVQRATEG
jgi:hypothetical protein